MKKAAAMLQVVRIMTSSVQWRGDVAAVQQAVVKIQAFFTPQGTAIIPSAAFRPVSIMSPSAGHSSFLILHYVMVMMERNHDADDALVLKCGSRYLGQCCHDAQQQKEVGRQVEEALLSSLALLGLKQEDIDSFINPLKAIIVLGSVSGTTTTTTTTKHRVLA